MRAHLLVKQHATLCGFVMSLVKDNQIDTLYFLSRYDLENGDRAAALEKLEKAAEGRFSPLNYCTRDNILAEIAALKGEA